MYQYKNWTIFNLYFFSEHIKKNQRTQFSMFGSTMVDNHEVPYDYLSIMHYGAYVSKHYLIHLVNLIALVCALDFNLYAVKINQSPRFICLFRIF